MLAESRRRLAPAHESALRQLLRDTIGAELDGYAVAGARLDYAVLVATVGARHAQLVIKLAGPDAPFVHPFARVAELHRRIAAHTSLPIAEVLAFSDAYDGRPWRFLIRRHIAGQEWAAIRDTLNAAERGDVDRQIGGAVAELHALAFDAWGAIGADGGVAQPTHDPVAALARRATASIAKPALRALFLGVLAERAARFADIAPPALCHDDLHHFNILLSQDAGRWRLATILDFDKSWAGFAESDLARMELWNMAGEGFWQAYRARHTVPDGYRARRPLLQLLWCLEYGAATPQHNADTARVCAELGIAPIRFG